MTARPHRQRKSDRLICPGSSAHEIECDYAIAPFDRAALDMERRWGVDRLPELVTPALAARFGAAMAFLNDRLNANDAEGVAAAAANCVKGLAAMDAEAISLGHRPIPADVWLYEMEGHRFGIVKDSHDWPTLQADHPGLTIYTLREVANALAVYRNEVVQAAKAAFPGAEAVAIRKRTATEEFLEDEIPW